MINENERLAVGAILHADDESVDALLVEFARDLRKRGWQVRGIVQIDTPCDEACASQMALVDLDDGNRFVISQNLGSGSVSCNIDPAGVAAAGVALRRALAEGADLVIANRFGGLEARGGGLTAEMLGLMANGLPLLTVVANRFLGDWRRFTGNAATELPPQREALEAWWQCQLEQHPLKVEPIAT